jgi:hypothetical protein
MTVQFAATNLMTALRLMLGPIFKKWQHLIGPMARVFIQGKCSLPLNFLLQDHFPTTNIVIIDSVYAVAMKLFLQLQGSLYCHDNYSIEVC